MITTITITDRMVEKLLFNFSLCSKVFAKGNNKIAIKKEKSKGASSECPKIAMYVKLIKQNSTSANLGRKESLSFIVILKSRIIQKIPINVLFIGILNI